MTQNQCVIYFKINNEGILREIENEANKYLEEKKQDNPPYGTIDPASIQDLCQQFTAVFDSIDSYVNFLIAIRPLVKFWFDPAKNKQKNKEDLAKISLNGYDEIIKDLNSFDKIIEICKKIIEENL